VEPNKIIKDNIKEQFRIFEIKAHIKSNKFAEKINNVFDKTKK